jgi:NSS family neurotransmitter:Na+ symporter
MAGGNGFLGLMDIIWGKYGLTIGALGICLFVGWRWGISKAKEEIEGGGHKLPAAAFWGFLVRWVCPLAVLVILGLVVAGKANF